LKSQNAKELKLKQAEQVKISRKIHLNYRILRGLWRLPIQLGTYSVWFHFYDCQD